ncbi:MAG: hypothetical protein SOT18_05765 [Eubacterium sp.]|nr:hypothetical protein [Eubacterium sp.]
MSVNGITSGVSNSYTSTSVSKEKASKTETKKTADTGVVYEPSTSAKDSNSTKVTDYSSIVASMKKELSSKNEQLQNLVNKLLSNQAKKYVSLSDMFKDIQVNEQTKIQAQKDISDDGYWGVEQTSDRLVSMAKALSGGDSSKADAMISAIEKGFDEATKAWGDKLPDICQKTIDVAKQKLQNWRDGGSDTTTEAAN